MDALGGFPGQEDVLLAREVALQKHRHCGYSAAKMTFEWWTKFKGRWSKIIAPGLLSCDTGSDREIVLILIIQ